MNEGAMPEELRRSLEELRDDINRWFAHAETEMRKFRGEVRAFQRLFLYILIPIWMVTILGALLAGMFIR